MVTGGGKCSQQIQFNSGRIQNSPQKKFTSMLNRSSQEIWLSSCMTYQLVLSQTWRELRIFSTPRGFSPIQMQWSDWRKIKRKVKWILLEKWMRITQNTTLSAVHIYNVHTRPHQVSFWMGSWCNKIYTTEERNGKEASDTQFPPFIFLMWHIETGTKKE